MLAFVFPRPRLPAGSRRATCGCLRGTTIAVLHERVLRGHQDAVEALIERVLPVLARRLGRRFPRAPQDQVATAVEDALLAYVARPERFDGARGVPLLGFLYLASMRNLSNARRADARRHARESRAAAALALRRAADETPEIFFERSDPGEILDSLRRQLSYLTPRERESVAQWMDGERRTTVLADVLGILGLPVTDQRRALTQLKDRVRKQL